MDQEVFLSYGSSGWSKLVEKEKSVSKLEKKLKNFKYCFCDFDNFFSWLKHDYSLEYVKSISEENFWFNYGFWNLEELQQKSKGI